nr:unnamed protein product [Spirometra erinaceieuropaei]
MANEAITLAIFKPDVQRIMAFRKLAELAIHKSGLKILLQREFRMSRRAAESFYAAHKGKFFYERLVNYMIAGPIGVYVLSGDSAITRWRQLIGPTKVYRAVIFEPESLRGTLGLTDTRNGFHGSDSRESALEEISFFFPDLDLEKLLK